MLWGTLGLLLSLKISLKWRVKLFVKKIILKQALETEKAGAFSIVLECLDTNLSKIITKSLKIPTIGIGASANCDGQILVTDDLLGLSGFYPKFVKKYVNLRKIIKKAVSKYKKEVKQNKFQKLEIVTKYYE